jgi:hypothetical protein
MATEKKTEIRKKIADFKEGPFAEAQLIAELKWASNVGS